MTAHELIQYISWIIYIAIFVSVTFRAIRRPLRTSIDIALFFGVTTLLIIIGVAQQARFVGPSTFLTGLSVTLYLAMVYVLLRLVYDFSHVPTWLMRLSEAALVLLSVATFVFVSPAGLPAWLSLPALAYLIGLLIYTVVAFMRQSGSANGVTKRRMIAVAAGSIALCLVFVLDGLQAFVPALSGVWGPLGDAIALASGICYFLGFAPPGILRRAWQEPELRAFLGRAATLPRLPDTESIIGEMERGAAGSLGAPNAGIALWDEEARSLRLHFNDTIINLAPERSLTSGRAFLDQEPVFNPAVTPDNPLYGTMSGQNDTWSLLAAPITAGEKRLGVLIVYAQRAPIFAEEDLALAQLLADQAAVILESRALIDEAARVRAREEVARLKEDFLSAAAHDLKTPLTTLVGQAQLLERRAISSPNAPADLTGIKKLVHEANRLKVLVLELLDAASTEQGRLVGQREDVDLRTLAREVCATRSTERHPCNVEADAPVVGHYDRGRILQMLENLVENAVKYSPAGGPVRVRVWVAGGSNHITVTDSGIGIPQTDLDNIFDRFYRAANVDDRRFAGMGLGLYICRGIAEQHGGRICATSHPGQGSTFHVALPAATPQPVEPRPIPEEMAVR